MAVVPDEAEPVSQFEMEVFAALHRNWPSRKRQKLTWVSLHRDRLRLLFENPIVTEQVKDLLRSYL